MMTLALCIIGLTLACTGFAMVFSSVTAHWRTATRCVNCGYDLCAHPEGSACPECGQMIGAFRDGFIERRPLRMGVGLILLVAALGAFTAAFAAMLGY